MKVDLRAFKSMLKKVTLLGEEEVRMSIKNEKLHGRFVDMAHVAMLDMTLQLDNCKIKPLDFCIEIPTLFSKVQDLPIGNIHKKGSAENYLRIKTIFKKGTIAQLEFYHPMLTFQKNLFHTTSISEPEISKGLLTNIDAIANINTRQFKIFLKIAARETDHIAFIAEKKENKLRTEFVNDNSELAKMDLTYSLGGIEGIDLRFKKESAEQVKALFSIDYMQQFVNNLKAPTMKLGLKKDNPVVIWWKEADKLSGVYILAPRIESE